MTIASRISSKTKIIKSKLKFKTHPIYKVKLIILSIKVTILGMAHFQCRFWAFSFDLSFNEKKNGSKIKLTQFKNYTSKMVFCYQNCSDLLWEKNCSSDWEKLLKFEAEGREFENLATKCFFKLFPEVSPI